MGREKRKKNLIMIIIPSVIAVTIGLLLLNSMSGVPAPGNKMLLHNHAILNVTYYGQNHVVSQNIGVGTVGKAENPLLYGDHSLDKYGMEGMSPLHTHDSSGTIHVESNTVRNYTLGEFLAIWKGLNIDGNSVTASLDGKPVSDYRNIVLNDKSQIVLDITS